MVGWLDENQGRSYPLQPTIPEWRPLFVDLALVYGDDLPYHLLSDSAQIWEVRQVVGGWEVEIRRNPADSSPLVVEIPDASPLFSTHHVASIAGRSYVYLTIGSLSDFAEYLAVGSGLLIEDRCTVVAQQSTVTLVEAANGQKNRSLRDTWSYVSAIDPGLNYTASLGGYVYDPDVLDTVVGSAGPPGLGLAAGSNVQLQVVDGEIVLRLRTGAGGNCCFELPEDQTPRKTFRTVNGKLPDNRGAFSWPSSPGFEISTVPGANTVRMSVALPQPTTRCVQDLALPEPPVISDPPPIDPEEEE